MIAIIDYEAGNIKSVDNAMKYLGREAVLTRDRDIIAGADRVILPGVGAFGDAADKLRATGLDQVVIEEARRGKPLMGICLGMQLLFEKGYEFGEHDGLGLLKGSIIPMQGTIPEGLKIPQMGWNALIKKREHFLLRDVREGDCVYFVHSFYAAGCEDSLVAVCDYGREITALAARDNVMGCQFHPEKSGPVGLSILKAFCEVSP